MYILVLIVAVQISTGLELESITKTYSDQGTCLIAKNNLEKTLKEQKKKNHDTTTIVNVSCQIPYKGE